MKIRMLFFGLVSGIISTFFLSCNKNTPIGVDILPSGDFINGVFSDTFSLISTTVRQDSVKTSTLFNNVLGNMLDPVFGKTYAAIFTELKLPTNSVDFGTPDTLFIDSVVLTLAYAGIYGFSDVPQSISVFEVTEPLSPLPADGYYSDKFFSVNPEPIGSRQFLVPDLTDTVIVLGLPFPPHLRIRLSDSFGQNILNQSGGTNLSTDTLFREFLKGLLIAPDTVSTPNSASLIYLNLLSPTSGLRLYWHTPKTTSQAFVLPITTDIVKTNYYRHNYSGSEVEKHLQFQSSEGDSIVYVQPLGGVKTRINIPALNTLKNVLINKAEIIITQAPDPQNSDTAYTTPTILYLAASDSLGRNISLPDQLLVFPSPGGQRTFVTNSSGATVAQYHFSIAKQLQLIIDQKKTDYGLFIIPYSPGENAARLRAGGSNRNDDMKMRLDLIYTNLK
ncbi:MAG: DUF4270 domain-containing protein [Chitinophagales bacterium]|nr:DUF4270 domain-containing protein [Chitinophagales bacterium]